MLQIKIPKQHVFGDFFMQRYISFVLCNHKKAQHLRC